LSLNLQGTSDMQVNWKIVYGALLSAELNPLGIVVIIVIIIIIIIIIIIMPM